MARAVVLNGIDLEIAPKWISLVTRRVALSVSWESRNRGGWWAEVDRDMAGTTWELQAGRMKLMLTRKSAMAKPPTAWLAADRA